jgi:adenylate kinase
VRLVLLGPPGSGKGTQGAMIASQYGIPKLSTGELLRAEVASQSPLGQNVAHLLDAGELVPDKLVFDVLAARIHQPDCEKGVILDGYPRTKEQAVMIDALFRQKGWQLDAVLHFYIADAVVVERISSRITCQTCHTISQKQSNSSGPVCTQCGGSDFYCRTDDHPEAVERRLAIFHQTERPLLEFYKEQGILVTVHADASVEKVRNEIDSTLKRISP